MKDDSNRGRKPKTVDDILKERSELEARTQKAIENYEKSKKQFLEELNKIELAEKNVLEVERKFLKIDNIEEEKRILERIEKIKRM